MTMRFLSVCSGIEAASVAWLPLGWQAVAYSEIEPFACAVLAHHYPDVPNIGDMTQVFDWRHYAGAVDLVVAGTPCQDFSVAGKRAGLAGERSALAMVFVQVLSVVRPEWFLWENVPGVFSTNGGRDFGTYLRTLDDIGYSCAWRVLDAQYFGVPQRRRRVFVVGHLGDWRPAAAVLFEPHCLRGDTAPRRKAAENVAGTITASAGRSGGKGTDFSLITQALTGRLGGGGPDDNKAQGGFYVPDIVSQAISCKWSKGTSGPSGDEHHNLVCSPLTTRPWADHEAQHTKLVISQYGDKAAALTCEGADASPCADRGPTVIAFHGSQDPDVSGVIAHPVARNQGRECCIAFTERGRTVSHQTITPQMRVRRLTPRECERLQGFPDDYTAIVYRGKPAADAPRYRALGNSMAVPVMRWIGERINHIIQERA